MENIGGGADLNVTGWGVTLSLVTFVTFVRRRMADVLVVGAALLLRGGRKGAVCVLFRLLQAAISGGLRFRTGRSGRAVG